MARKKKHEEHENHERWLISYADFITLLFAFFVVMYSLSAINEGKLRILSASLSASFRGPPRSMEPIQVGKPIPPAALSSTDLPFTPMLPTDDPFVSSPSPINIKVMSKPPPVTSSMSQAGKLTVGEGDEGEGEGSGGFNVEMEHIADDIEAAMDILIQADLVRVRRFRFWLEIEINTNILFPSGSAILIEDALPILSEIGDIIGVYPNPVQIEGYTDNVPINTWQYPSNWELSTARATSVLQLLVSYGVSPERMSAVGHGEFKPAAPNDTEAGRQANRRVVLVILSLDTVNRLYERNPGNDILDIPEELMDVQTDITLTDIDHDIDIGDSRPNP